MAKKKYKIPFVLENYMCFVKGQGWVEDKNPTWQMYDYANNKEPNHPGFLSATTPFEWRDVYEFEDELKIHGWGKGRSAVRVYLHGTDGTRYTATMTAFMDAVEMVGVVNNTIPKLKWTFAKKGSNYTIQPVQEQMDA